MSQELPSPESENPYEAPVSDYWTEGARGQVASIEVVRPLWQASGWMRFTGIVIMCVSSLILAGVVAVSFLAFQEGGTDDQVVAFPIALVVMIFYGLPLFLMAYLVGQASRKLRRGFQEGAAEVVQSGLRYLVVLVWVLTVVTALAVFAFVMSIGMMVLRFLL